MNLRKGKLKDYNKQTVPLKLKGGLICLIRS